MKVGCFALVDPFSTLEHQLERVAGMGFKYADVTDNHPGGQLGREFGFSATASLDGNPADLKAMFDRHGLTATSVCAHANLLDASAPSCYATDEICKAVRLAAGMGVRDVVTTEGDPKTAWGKGLTREEQIFITTEKLFEPARLAEALGVRLLLEPHGPVSGTIDGLSAVLDRLGMPETVGVNIDTGNAWLAGTDPVEMAKLFKDRIWHIHWKDMAEEWTDKRGTLFGCGMAVIPLGSGVVDIKSVYDVLADGPAEFSTLEIAGDENVIASYEFLKGLGAE